MKKFAAILLSAALVAPLATPTMAQPASQSQDDRDGPNQGRNQGQGQGQGRNQGQGQGPAQGRNEGRGPDQARGGRDQGQAGGFKSFRKGERFDSGRARNYQSIDYRKYRSLKAPPRGYRYVRAGDDILLISAAGVVAAVTAGAFH